MALDRTWYNTLVDDDGSNTVGTVWGKDDVDHLMDEVDLEIARLDTDIAAVGSGVVEVVASTVTGTQHNYLIGSSGGANVLIEWAGASDATFTGLKEFASAATTTGRVVTIKNTGSNVAYLAYSSGSSLAAHRLVNFITSGSTPIAAGGSATYVFDGTNWKLTTHQQGAWISVTYSGSNFTHSAGTWTVDSGDQVTYAYEVKGKTMAVSVALFTTSVSGAAGGQLRVAIPAGCVSSRAMYFGCQVSDNGTHVAGLAEVGAAATFMAFYRADLGNYATATNTTAVRAGIFFEVN